MKVSKYRIALFSNDPDRLADFYIRVLAFIQTVKVDRPGEYGFGIEAAPGYKLWIAKHSEINGLSKEPFRVMLSFYVDDIEKYFERVVKTESSTIIEAPTLTCQGISGEERIVGAFLDPDGNCVQMMQMTGN
jgi:predicted enzyme related to lactoylglutathione lyase